MKSFALDEMLLISLQEKKARRVPFHPQVTVIRGENDTGKSSIIKSIFATFGAPSPTISHRWTAADVKSFVRFRVGGKKYALLKDGATYTAFDENDEIINVFSSVTKGLGPFLASLFDFQLKLSNRAGELQTPPPAYFLLPFYIDQDNGWRGNWASFGQLGQFPSWRKDLVQYHVGLRPNDYYVTKGRILELRSQLAEPERRLETLDRVLKDLDEKFGAAKFDLDVDAFKAEIDRLLAECARLQEAEQKYRHMLVHLETQRLLVKNQMEIVTRASEEFQDDYDFAASDETEDSIDCPACGQPYHNGFAQRFAIAKDADDCLHLLSKLREEHDDLQKKIDGVRADFTKNEDAQAAVTATLNAKHKAVTLHEVIANEGKKTARKVIADELQELLAYVRAEQSQIDALVIHLRSFDDRKRRQEIVEEYAAALRRFAAFAGLLTLPPGTFTKVDSQLKVSGSEMPRAVLAYSLTVLRLIAAHSSAVYCPYIVDSPNQQDQDPVNLAKMFELLRDFRPEGTQLVLGTVNTLGVEFPGKEIELTEKLACLQASEYDDVSAVVLPLINRSLEFEKKQSLESEE